MIDRLTLTLALVLAAGCAREEPTPRASAPQPREEADEPTSPKADEEDRASARGPKLLWIFPRLSATLKGEQAEPLSQPAVLGLADGSAVRLGVRIREGELVHLPDQGGRTQTIYLELLELTGDEGSRTLHQFTLPLEEGPDAEPTDDMLRAWVEDGSRIVVALARRGLREEVEELEREPEVVETVVLFRSNTGTLQSGAPPRERRP